MTIKSTRKAHKKVVEIVHCRNEFNLSKVHKININSKNFMLPTSRFPSGKTPSWKLSLLLLFWLCFCTSFMLMPDMFLLLFGLVASNITQPAFTNTRTMETTSGFYVCSQFYVTFYWETEEKKTQQPNNEFRFSHTKRCRKVLIPISFSNLPFSIR